MTFEERFFGPGNLLRWNAIQTDSIPIKFRERLRPFLEDVQQSRDLLVLPRLKENGSIQWYALCSSARSARVVRLELRAFLGPSYSDFEGQPTQLDPSDSVDAAVLEKAGHNSFRFELADEARFPVACERLRLLLRLRDERPTRDIRRIRPTGRILRDFEYALLLGDGTSARACIAELRVTGRLDAVNLLFLEIRRLSALSDWEAILALPELEALLSLVRPKRVTEALIRAVYACELRLFEENGRPGDALAYFRTRILPRFSNLYLSRSGLSGHDVDVSFVLLGATSTPTRYELVEQICSSEQDVAHRAYLNSIEALLPVRPTVLSVSPLLEAHQAFIAGDIDRAYRLANEQPPSFERCSLLLRCARDMGTLEATRTALRSVEDSSSDDQNRIHRNGVLTHIYNSLSAMATPTVAPPPVSSANKEVPASWSAWLRRLEALEGWPGAIHVAEAAAREWGIAEVVTNAKEISTTANLILADRPEWGNAALRDALPYLVEFFLSGGVDPRLKPIYDAVFMTIAVDDQISLPQLSALVRVSEARLGLGVSALEYREVVTQLMSSVHRLGTPSAADHALDTLDMLIGVPCPAPEARQEFLVNLAGLFQRWYRRIDTAQWTLLKNLGDELGVPDLVDIRPSDEAPMAVISSWDALAGLKVALYSLRESALRRASAVLSALCPQVVVQIFCTTVGGTSLKAAASSADVFVIATSVATHAATDFINAHRPKTRTTLYARGGGSAGLLEAIRNYLPK